jgi:uncharacterized protein (DUF3084 family)
MVQAELMFLKALRCEPDVQPKAMINLGLLYNTRSSFSAQNGDLDGAMAAILDSAKHLDAAKRLIDGMTASEKAVGDIARYIQQFQPLRLQCHTLQGQLLASAGDMVACEAEFRLATESFPSEPRAWHMLKKVLEIQGKASEAQSLEEKINSLLPSR